MTGTLREEVNGREALALFNLRALLEVASLWPEALRLPQVNLLKVSAEIGLLATLLILTPPS